MAINVFVSWSGDRSKKLGEAICAWVPSVLQNTKLYFTPNDIQKGAKWNSEISQELEASHIGIVCLTKENKEKPWIMFEVGALAKQLDKSKICTLLFGMSNSDLSGPLTQFQSTIFEKEEIRKLLNSINVAGEENSKVNDDVLRNSFDMCWPKLESEISSILATPDSCEDIPERDQKEIVVEVLNLVRDLHSREISTSTKDSESIEHKDYDDLLKNYSKMQTDYIVILKEYNAALRILAKLRNCSEPEEVIDYLGRHETIGELIAMVKDDTARNDK